MHLIITDTKESAAVNPEDVVIRELDRFPEFCRGCFACWVKTPGKCILQDAYSDMGALLGKAEQLTIVSACTYGGYSPFVKTVLDRSISYLHPDFEIREGRMHHKRRYAKDLAMCVRFYGTEITEEEQRTAQDLVRANARNLGASLKGISFHTSAQGALREAERCR